jgi:ERF superfamily protein
MSNEEAYVHAGLDQVIRVVGNRSQSLAALAAALAKAQGEMAGASKDSLNPHFKAKYASLASVWDACRAALSKNGLSVLQPVRADGARVTVTTILAHNSGEWISEDLTVTAQSETPQGIGSALTYCRRYSLASMVGIAPEDDDGEEASAEKQPVGDGRKQPTPPPSPSTKPEPPPAPPRPVVAGELRVTNAKVAKTGTNSKGPWTLYIVKFSDGREASTFSKSMFEAAESAAHDGRAVDVEIEGKNLVSLMAAYTMSREELASDLA